MSAGAFNELDAIALLRSHSLARGRSVIFAVAAGDRPAAAPPPPPGPLSKLPPRLAPKKSCLPDRLSFEPRRCRRPRADGDNVGRLRQKGQRIVGSGPPGPVAGSSFAGVEETIPRKGPRRGRIRLAPVVGTTLTGMPRTRRPTLGLHMRDCLGLEPIGVGDLGTAFGTPFVVHAEA
jgi:hypothetical protein